MADIKNWKRDFLESHDKSEEDPKVVAQRLINIYRQLSVLGEDAVKEYNANILTEATPEILIALRALPCGEEIREYINFIENKDLEDHSQEEGLQEDTLKLPEAEQLSPLWETFGASAFGMPASVGSSSTQIVTPSSSKTPTVSAMPLAPHLLIEEKNESINSTALNSDSMKILKDESLALLEAQNQNIVEALKYVEVNSNVSRTQESLQEALNKITALQNRNIDILSSIYNGDKTIPPNEQEKKQSPPFVFASQKKKKKKRKIFSNHPIHVIEESNEDEQF